MNWLKKARGLKRISSKALAEECGLSMNYVQKIEGGNRDLPHSTASQIFSALGFTPEEVRFDTEQLITELAALGENDKCYLRYRVVDEVVYFTDIESKASAETMELRTADALLLLKSQQELFD